MISTKINCRLNFVFDKPVLPLVCVFPTSQFLPEYKFSSREVNAGITWIGVEFLRLADIGLTCLRLVKWVLGFYHKLNIGFQMVKSSYSVILRLHLNRGFGKLSRTDVWSYDFLQAQKLWGCERCIIEHCTARTCLFLHQ